VAKAAIWTAAAEVVRARESESVATWEGKTIAQIAEQAAGKASSAFQIANELPPRVGVTWAEAAASAENLAILDCILPSRIRFSPPVHVSGLAATIHEKRDWSLMPILADALEEIGRAQMAAHCRQVVHAKGCHVLDAILGR
jgi:hypothetical protein